MYNQLNLSPICHIILDMQSISIHNMLYHMFYIHYVHEIPEYLA